MICYLYPKPTYFFFAPDLPDLLYYSHIPSVVIALLVGFFVFFHARHLLLNRLLLIISLCFSLWVLLSLLVWVGNDGAFFAFIWPFFAILTALLSIFCIYFTYVFINKNDVTNTVKLVFLVLLAPVLLLAHTNLSITGFDLTACDPFRYEGLVFKIYHTTLGAIAMIWIFILLYRAYRQADVLLKKQIILMGTGIEFFIFLFFSIVFLITYLTGLGLLPDSQIEMYGLFGMTFFMGMIAYLIVKFKTFNVKLLGAQALIVSLFILTASMYTFADTGMNRVLISITLFIITGAGYFLVKSVKKEVKLREEITQLAVKLKRSNDKLKVLDQMKSEFVSIASHQLRSPLTAMRGYSSMLVEGSYGKLPPKALEVVQNIEESTKFMVSSVEDYLNVSRIEAGNMKYELSDFSLKETAEKIVDEMRSVALKKGLVIVFRSDCDGGAIINADIGKTRQVLLNLIDNAMKYTQKGTITVVAHDDLKKKKMRVTIQDTGVGMSKETVGEVFDKFVRAKNANEINVTGTGLGLYVARKMMTGMKGEVWAESEGEGMGSRFIVEFPLSQDKTRR